MDHDSQVFRRVGSWCLARVAEKRCDPLGHAGGIGRFSQCHQRVVDVIFVGNAAAAQLEEVTREGVVELGMSLERYGRSFVVEHTVGAELVASDDAGASGWLDYLILADGVDRESFGGVATPDGWFPDVVRVDTQSPTLVNIGNPNDRN